MDSLNDDVLLYLMKFLSPADRLSLAISDISERFAILYGQQKSFSLSRDFKVDPVIVDKFLLKYVGRHIQALDMSHCYWLPVALIVEAARCIENLSEFYVHDTQFSIFHLPQVLLTCGNLKRLSISFCNSSWDQFCESGEELTEFLSVAALKLLTKGFQQLSHVKFTAINATSCANWLDILRILGWCINCTHLHLEPVYTEDYFVHGPYGEEEADDSATNFACAYLFSKLSWMDNLKSFVYVKRGCLKYPDHLIEVLCQWMFHQLQMPQMEHLWIQSKYESITYSKNLPSNISYLSLGHYLPSEIYENCQTITHISGIELASLPQLKNLQFFRGFCSTEKGLDELCRTHPSLKHLFVDDEHVKVSLGSDWKLPHLQTLGYTCGFSTSNLTDRLIDAFPNIIELHLGYLNSSAIVEVPGQALEQLCLLKRLRRLTLSSIAMMDAEPLKKIFHGCRHLQVLHLSDLFYENNTLFIPGLIDALPAAQNLQDFRLHWDHRQAINLRSFFSAIQLCGCLQRLVLFHDIWEDPESQDSTFNAELVGHFVNSLQHLVALCLIEKMAPDWMEEVSDKLKREVVPFRPSFWFYIGHDLPKGNDSSVPRIHYDEIVNPVNYYHIPPMFP